MSTLFTAPEIETELRALAFARGLLVTSFATRMEEVEDLGVTQRVAELTVRKTAQSHDQYHAFSKDVAWTFRQRNQDAPRLGWYERWDGQHPDIAEDQAMILIDLITLTGDEG